MIWFEQNVRDFGQVIAALAIPLPMALIRGIISAPREIMQSCVKRQLGGTKRSTFQNFRIECFVFRGKIWYSTDRKYVC